MKLLQGPPWEARESHEGSSSPFVPGLLSRAQGAGGRAKESGLLGVGVELGFAPPLRFRRSLKVGKTPKSPRETDRGDRIRTKALDDGKSWVDSDLESESVR